MRLRLASLALLLLALCRTASSDFVDESNWEEFSAGLSDSDISLSDSQKEEFLKKLITEAKFKTGWRAKLDKVMGNTLYGLIMYAAGKYQGMPDYYKNAIKNGILCEKNDANFEKNIKDALYGLAAADPLTDDQKAAEFVIAMNAPDVAKIDCTAGGGTDDKAFTCFCTEPRTKPYLYCLAQKIDVGGYTQKPCKKIAIDTLKTKGTRKLGEMLEKHENLDVKEEASEITKNENAEVAKFLCDALDSDVETAVKAVYASDAMFWTVDAIDLAKYFGTLPDIKVACENEEFKTHPMGVCMCTFEVGFSFCLTKVIAKKFADETYLDCTANPKKFDATKKPAPEKVKEVIPKKVKAAPTPAPAPGPGNDPNATTPAKPDAAATSSLLLASLSVAAAMLLRH